MHKLPKIITLQYFMNGIKYHHWIILIFLCSFAQLFHDRGRYHTETSPLICSANQWTGFYMIMAPVIKELKPLILAQL